MQISTKLSQLQQRIEQACAKVGRNPQQVQLLLATKTVKPQLIKQAFACGQTLIGENRIQEVIQKHAQLANSDYQQHFIGHLQTNKVKDLLRYNINCLQSLDRMRLAQRLHNRLEYEDKTIDVFLQFNTSYEASKYGMAPENALQFAKQVAEFERINIKGLMTIGLFSAEKQQVRQCFQRLKQIQNQLLDAGINATELSMGMSGDFEIAIAEGATIIRVGSAIFGERPHPDSYYWNEN